MGFLSRLFGRKRGAKPTQYLAELDPQIPIIGREVLWTQILRQVMQVHSLERNGTVVETHGVVRPKSSDEPYGFLVVTSPVLDETSALPIIHRDDFLLATHVFDVEEADSIVTEFELLVTYVPEVVIGQGLSGSPSHVLHYILVPKGTLTRYYHEFATAYDGDRVEKLFGGFVFHGEISVKLIEYPQLPDQSTQSLSLSETKTDWVGTRIQQIDEKMQDGASLSESEKDELREELSSLHHVLDQRACGREAKVEELRYDFEQQLKASNPNRHVEEELLPFDHWLDLPANRGRDRREALVDYLNYLEQRFEEEGEGDQGRSGD